MKGVSLSRQSILNVACYENYLCGSAPSQYNMPCSNSASLHKGIHCIHKERRKCRDMYLKWQDTFMTVQKLQLLAQLPGQLDIVYRCLCWSTVLHNIMKWNMYSQFQLLLAYHPQTSWSPCTVMQPGLLQPIYIASLCSLPSDTLVSLSYNLAL